MRPRQTANMGWTKVKDLGDFGRTNQSLLVEIKAYGWMSLFDHISSSGGGESRNEDLMERSASECFQKPLRTATNLYPVFFFDAVQQTHSTLNMAKDFLSPSIGWRSVIRSQLLIFHGSIVEPTRLI